MNSKKPQDNNDLDGQNVRNNEANISENSNLSQNADIDSIDESSRQEISFDNPDLYAYQRTTAAICVIEVLAEEKYLYIDFNRACQAWLGTTIEKLKNKTPEEIFAPEDVQTVVQTYNNCVRAQKPITYEEYLVVENERSCWLTTVNPQIDKNGRVNRLISTSVNISQRRQIEAEITIQANREKLLSAISLRINQSLDLPTILQQTVKEVRSFLETDRVLIYRFDDRLQGSIAVESVVPTWDSILEKDKDNQDPCFTPELVDLYRQGKIQVIEDITQSDLPSCYLELLISCQVKANLIVPIVAEAKLWGLLIAQHCSSPRKWLEANIELLKQLANRVGIAVQQAELHQKVQNLNVTLEAEVEQRTAQLQSTLAKLQQALQSEELIRSITEAIRDSLDEKQILQTATESLTKGLKIECCQIELYKYHHTTTEVICEYPIVSPDARGIHRKVENFAELYQPLLAKKVLHFVDLLPAVGYRQQQVTRLICPIFDDRGILGNLWLMRPKESVFEPEEIKLVQQIADRCAIAIRQARLYKAEQVQVKELEKLNVVKDDFLKTISHELRTPMSRLRLAVSTLENLLEAEVGAHNSARINKVMDIFHASFKKHNQLVDDLLTLCYVDATSKPNLWQSIDLKTWIPQIVKTFSFGANPHKLQLDLAEDLPPLRSDPKMLQRAVNELLNNAHKYTPSEGSISIKTEQTADRLLLKIINTGVEIPVEEQERIFDKFYRIPNSDPWQHGGTGIGLALVKKLVELLEGNITVSSQEQKTIFTISFSSN